MYRFILLSFITFLLNYSLLTHAKGVKNNGEIQQLKAYTVLASAKDAERLRREHYDISGHMGVVGEALKLEVIMTPAQAERLEQQGIQVTLNLGQQSLSRLQTTGALDSVFRPYGGAGGLQEEVQALADEYPELTELKVIGQSGLGVDILAIKVSKKSKRGSHNKYGYYKKRKAKPAVLYVSTQHAREWITPEVNRRLLHYFLENYDSDPLVTEVVNTTDLWFVLVANPDGYDYTFTEGNRLWRKTLTDNDGDGQITIADGVDPNRNFPTFWGYDEEGSSSISSSGVYRGPSPASEPETQALDHLVRTIRPKFLVNYHSAAELILYGTGFQVATTAPDDVILAALAGDDANPAIEGFDPDLSAELYTTNGETTEHMGSKYGVLAYTPELSRCQTVAPDPTSCFSIFAFPDDDALIQAEFEKNLPFALDIAQSAQNPFEPVSHLGNTVPDFVVDEFSVSHGTSQTVQANISRQIRFPFLFYRVNGGVTRIAWTREWRGGERYGGDFNDYYRDVRGKIRGLNTGDSVEYWFAGFLRPHGFVKSDRANFDVTDNPARVLVIANEDYDGVTPEQFVSEPQYLSYYTDALESNGMTYDVWDLDAQGAPAPLGVLSHYDALIWYVGDNIITQDLEDRDLLFPNSELGVSEVMQLTTIAVRDYLNEGGRLLKTGDRAGYFGQFAANVGGLFYGDNGAPSEPCTVEGSIFGDCLIFSDDFHQYWLGDFSWSAFGEPGQVLGVDGSELDGLSLNINGVGSANNSFDAGQSLVTSSVLSPEQFPTFADSRSIAEYAAQSEGPFLPFTGEYYLGVLARDNQYNRITRGVDLTTAATAALSFATSFNIEPGFDFFVVEVREAGTNGWTTLNDLNGNTPDVPLTACTEGLWGVHPFIFEHYVDEATCASPGPTGEFHAFNGNSNGWINASFDLSAFAGKQLEVSLSYISDAAVPLTGVFVDDLSITVDGAVETQGWESDQAPWSVALPPTGSPASATDWERSTDLIGTTISAAVATDRSVYLPFGFEAIATPIERHQVMGKLLDHLLKQ